MSDAVPIVSPLAGYSFSSFDGVAISEAPLASLVQVSAWPDIVGALTSWLAERGLPALPSPGGSTVAGGVTALDAGPGAAFLAGEGADLAKRLSDLPTRLGTATDLGHARIRLRLSGVRAPWVLAKGIALDLQDEAFLQGRCATTKFHHIGVTVHRSGAEEWMLYAYRGFALSLAESLVLAAQPDRVPG